MPRDANVAGSDRRAALPAAVVVSNVEARAVGDAGKGGSEFAAFSLTIPANATPGDTIFVRVPRPPEPATATRVSASGLAGRFVRAISASIGLGALAVVLVAVAVRRMDMEPPPILVVPVVDVLLQLCLDPGRP